MSSDSLVEAVMNADDALVRKLVAAWANTEECNPKRETPLIIAAKTDQFENAEVLIDAGANIWAASSFGWTAGYATETSNIAGGPEKEARDRVLAVLQARHFPFPAPHPDTVKDMVLRGQWPPVER